VWANPVQISVGGQPWRAAAPWATLSASVLQKTCFWNLMTNTPVHPKEQAVLGLMGATQPAEMFPSLLAKQLAPCLGTLQVQPVSVGATSANEGLTFGGAALPIVPPLALQSTLLNGQDALTNLWQLRDTTLNAVYDLYRNGTTAQKAYVDSLVTSTTQVRGISQQLLSNLNTITDNSINSQITAAVTLLQMNVTPVVVIHIPFGGDNHTDPGLQLEVSETITGIQNIATLMSTLASAQLNATFMTLNVFGRTMNKNAPVNRNGRGHNQYHQMSVTISSSLKGGVIGGIQPVAAMEYGCTDINSTNGAAAGNTGDIKAIDTLASFAKTVMASAGIDAATIESSIPSGKVIRGALV
jgi:hypothetical protein